MDLKVSLKSTASWGTGGNGEIEITNISTRRLTNWSINLSTSNFSIDSFYTLGRTGTNTNMTITPPSWNTTLQPGERIVSGFGYSGEQYFQYTSNSPNVQVEQVGVTLPVLNTQVQPTIISAKKTFGYFTEWCLYGRRFNVDMIPANKLSHIVYAFCLPNPSRSDLNILTSNYPFPPVPYSEPPATPEATIIHHDVGAANQHIPKLMALKRMYPHLKILISVGGWSLSWTFSKIAKDPVLRRQFVTSLTDLIIKYGFDGADLDWEFVGLQGPGYNYVDAENDGQNCSILLKELREEFDRQSPNYHLEITAATGCNPLVIGNYRLSEPYLDYLLLMTYDFIGAWSQDTGHQSAIYHNPNSSLPADWTVNASVHNAINAGFKNEKICVGSPFYARGWQNFTPTNRNSPIFGRATAGANALSTEYGETGVSSWKDLRDAINTRGYKEYFDEVAQASYVTNENATIVWSCDTPRSIRAKAQYVIDNNLAGMLFWELSDDTRDDKDNLLTVVNDIFSRETPHVTPIIPTPPIVTPPSIPTPPIVTPINPPSIPTPPIVTPTPTPPSIPTPPIVTPTPTPPLPDNESSVEYTINLPQSDCTCTCCCKLKGMKIIFEY